MTPEWVLKHQWAPDDRAWRWIQSCSCSLCSSETRGMAAAQQAGLTGLLRPVQSFAEMTDKSRLDRFGR
jgi:hypothetical protein